MSVKMYQIKGKLSSRASFVGGYSGLDGYAGLLSAYDIDLHVSHVNSKALAEKKVEELYDMAKLVLGPSVGSNIRYYITEIEVEG